MAGADGAYGGAVVILDVFDAARDAIAWLRRRPAFGLLVLMAGMAVVTVAALVGARP